MKDPTEETTEECAKKKKRKRERERNHIRYVLKVKERQCFKMEGPKLFSDNARPSATRTEA